MNEKKEQEQNAELDKLIEALVVESSSAAAEPDSASALAALNW